MKKKHYVEKHIDMLSVFLGVITGTFFMFFEYWVTAIGLGIVVFAFSQYVEALGKKMAIKEIIIVIASFQWILGPYIAYSLGNMHYKYRMYVVEEEYMNFVVPAVLAFIAGIYTLRSRYDFISIIRNFMVTMNIRHKHVYLMIFFSFAAGYLERFVPSVLLFVMFFIYQLKYIGVLYLLMVRNRYRWQILFLVMGFSLVGSLEHGLFHNFILWSAFIFSFICISLQLKRFTKYFVMVLGMVAIIAIQTVKADYREAIAGGYTGNKVVLFFNMIFNPPDTIVERKLYDRIEALNTRLNQGWIISAILQYVPSRIEYAEGETVVSAIQDALVPRVVVEKRRVHVRDNFMKYTGIHISEDTSMGVSILGESYINFGNAIGILFMYIWGLFISLIMKIMMNLSVTNPSLFLWLPLIFLQVVKAETELVVVLNHMVKSLLFLVAFYWGARRILKLKL